MIKNTLNAVLVGIVLSIPFVIIAGESNPVDAPVNPAFLRWMERKAKSTAAKNVVSTLSVQRTVESENTEDGRSYGLIPDSFDSSYLKRLRKNKAISSMVRTLPALPSRYDLREEGLLTSIKNQGSYGTCWAHAVCGALESSLLKAGEATYDFSENNMANLHGFDLGFNNGGNSIIASAYLLRWSGPVLESQDPYPNQGKSTDIEPARHVQNIRWIPGRSDYLDNDHIKQAVMDYGAIVADLYMDERNYLATDDKSYYFGFSATNDVNHSVAIVGWDDDYPASKFKNRPVGNGAFIMRNSWGGDRGENGYFYVSYYDKILGWHTMYAYLPPEKTDNYDSIYQYDPLGHVGAFGFNIEHGWGANIFVARETETIAAIGFYALTPNTAYTIYIYTDCEANSPRSGSLRHTQRGTTDSAGYYTIPLRTAVQIQKNSRFSVVLSLNTPGSKFPLAKEFSLTNIDKDGKPHPYSTAATAQIGESFYSSNGSAWSPMATEDPTENFCCKAYTKKAMGPLLNNDNFADAAVISGESGSVTASNEGATFENGEPEHENSSATTSVWWKWTPSKPGLATFSTEGSTFDTVLSVYTGNFITSLNPCASNDDGDGVTASVCSFEVVAGTTYYIAVAGYSAATGTIELSWNLVDRELPNLNFSCPNTDWPQAVFLSDVHDSWSVITNFIYGDTICLSVSYGNNGNAILGKDSVVANNIIDAEGNIVVDWSTSQDSLLQPGYVCFYHHYPKSEFSNLAPGAYTYRCTLDANNDIEEIDETDNVWEYEFEILTENYTVCFHKNDGSCETRDQTFTVGKAQNLLWKDSQLGWSVSGCTFAGWATSANGPVVYANGQSVTNLSTVQGAVVNLYAVWTYTLTLRRNAGSGDATSSRVTMRYGSGASLPWFDSGLKWTRTGYTFTGWSTNVSSAASYANGLMVTNLINTAGTLYAQYRPNTYTVRYHRNRTAADATVQNQSFTYDREQELKWLTNGLKWDNPGCTFLGWATNATSTIISYANGQRVKNLSSVKGAVVHLYAVWRPTLGAALEVNGRTITTGGNKSWYGQCSVKYSGTSAVQSGDISHGESSWMETVVKGPAEVSFWWKVSSEERYDKLKFFVDEESVSEVADISGEVDWRQEVVSIGSGTHTLKWVYSKDGSVNRGSDCGWVDQLSITVPSYTIRFYKNDGSGTVVTRSFASGKNHELPWINGGLGWANPFGCSIVGWSRSPTATSKTWSNGQTVKDLASAGGAIDLYLVWTSRPYTIRFHRNDGSGTVVTRSFASGKNHALPWINGGLGWTNPSGCSIVGWSRSSSATSKTWSNGQTVKDLASAGGAVDLYLVWTPRPYTIRFHKNDGSGTVVTRSFASGKNHALPWINGGLGWTNPAGCNIVGWARSSSATSKTWSNGQTVKDLASAGSSVDLYVVWSRPVCSYAVFAAPSVQAESATSVGPSDSLESELLPGYYCGELADGTGMYDLLVDEGGETGYVNIVFDDGSVLTEDVEVDFFGDIILVTDEDGEMYQLKL